MGRHLLRHCFIALFSCLAASVGQAEECSREATLKAGPGGAASEITFRNGSTVQRRVYWIDENGQRKLKAVVDGGKTQKQPTASTHAWVITDSAETCLYVVMASAAPMMVDIGGLVAVVEPPAAVPTKAAAAVEKPQRRNTCDPDEVRTARGTCVLRASTCRKNQVYSSSVKQCVLTSATCSPSEVYSSSQRKCIPKAVVTAPKAPKVPVCKYKTDGAGNCLSPSHKKCQSSWAACTKSCGTSVKCKNACENRYANICGD